MTRYTVCAMMTAALPGSSACTSARWQLQVVVEGPLLHMQALHEDDTSRAADTISIASDQRSTRLARGNMYAVLLPLSPCRMFLWCCMHIFTIVARPPVAYRSSSFLIALRSVHTDPAVLSSYADRCICKSSTVDSLVIRSNST